MSLVVFDDVPPPCTVADADGRPGHVVYQVVADRDSLGAGNINASNLLPVITTIMNQVVSCSAFIREGALCTIRFFQVAYKADRTIACLCESASNHREFAVVVVDENGVASDGIKPASLN